MEAPPATSYRTLCFAILLAAATQAIIIYRSPMVTADGITFTAIAKSLAHAPLETFRQQDQHPGYPALLLVSGTLVHAFGYQAEPDSWMLAGQLVGFVCGLLSVWVVWLLVREFLDQATANVAAVVFALLPVARQNAADALSDTPHMLCYALATWLALSGLARRDPWRLAGCGLACGLAYWIRPEGLLVFLVTAACLLGEALRARWTWPQTAWASAALVGMTVLVAAPYPLLAGKLTSKQLPEAKLKVASAVQKLVKKPAPPAADSAKPTTIVEPQPATAEPATAPTATTASVPPTPAAPPIPNTQSEAIPASPPRRNFRSIDKGLASLAYCLGQGLKLVFIPFFLIGQFWVLPRRGCKLIHFAHLALLGALHMALLVALFCFAGYLAHRHILPLMAVAMPCTALGLIFVAEKLGRFSWLTPARAQWAIVGVCAAAVLPFTVRPFCVEFVPVREATAWIEAQAPPGTGIVCNSPYVRFFGHLPTAELTSLTPTLDQALATSTDHNARYDYVVLHVGAHDYRSEWQTMIEQSYQPVREYLEPPNERYRPRKVIVFQSKARLAANAGSNR